MTTSINLASETATPVTITLECRGEQFVVLDFTRDFNVILPGRDLAAVRYLKALAVTLDKTANDLEDAIKAREMDALDRWANKLEAEAQTRQRVSA